LRTVREIGKPLPKPDHGPFGARGRQQRSFEASSRAVAEARAKADAKRLAQFRLITRCVLGFTAGAFVFTAVYLATSENAVEAMSEMAAPQISVRDHVVVDMTELTAVPDARAIDLVVNGRCYRRPSSGSEAATATAKLTKATDGRKVMMHFIDFGKFVACTGMTEVQRFCHSAFRQRFIERLRAYLTARGTFLGRMKWNVNDRHYKMSDDVRLMLLELGPIPEGAVLPHPEYANKKLRNVINDLSTSGYFSIHDFGFMGRKSVPRPVRSAFASAERTPNCP